MDMQAVLGGAADHIAMADAVPEIFQRNTGGNGDIGGGNRVFDDAARVQIVVIALQAVFPDHQEFAMTDPSHLGMRFHNLEIDQGAAIVVLVVIDTGGQNGNLISGRARYRYLDDRIARRQPDRIGVNLLHPFQITVAGQGIRSDVIGMRIPGEPGNAETASQVRPFRAQAAHLAQVGD